MLCLIPLGSQAADDFQTQIIEDIQYNVNGKGQAEVVVHFALPIRLTEQSIKDRASRTDTRVEFFLTDIQKKLLPLEEVRIAERDPEIPMHSVTYDGFNPNDPLISVQFKRRVAFVMKQNTADSVTITLPEIKPQAIPLNLVSKADIERIRARMKTMKKPKQHAPVQIAKRPPTPLPPPPVKSKQGKPTSKADRATLAKMEKARAALTQGNNTAAIKILNKVLKTSGHSYGADAYELLGLARERNGQLAFAKRIYEIYLKKYPKGANHQRVRQRLAELAPPEVVPAGTLVVSRSTRATRTDVFGSFSLFSFQGQQSGTDKRIDTTQSYMNLSARRRSSRFDMRSVANGTLTDRLDRESVIKNGLDTGRDENIHKRTLIANRLYFEFKDNLWNYNMRLGRQSGGSGIFGRFDGLKFGYDLSKSARLNAAYGYTVDFNEKETIKTNSPFISASMGLGSYYKYLDLTPYVFQQGIDGISNRTSLGLEARWNNPTVSAFSLYDYEASYGGKNLFMFNTIYRYSKSSTINFNYDDRRSPLLSTQNALNDSITLKSTCGVTDETTTIFTIEQALKFCSEDDIRKLAEANTGTSSIMTLAWNQLLNDHMQLNADVSQIKTTQARLIPLVDDPTKFEEDQEDADQVNYQVQLVFNRLFQRRDSNILGVRFINDQGYNTQSFSLSNRLSFGQSWRLHTRLVADFRTNKDDGKSTEKRLQPSVRLNYRYKRSFEIQTEWSYDTTNYSSKDIDDSNQTLFTLGIRYDF